MAVRNFYIDAEIDGRKTRLKGGPASKTGGFSLTVTIRGEGGIEKALEVWGQVITTDEGPMLRLSTQEMGDWQGFFGERQLWAKR